MVAVLSVGGSIVAPNQPDTEFLSKFSKMIRDWLAEDSERKIIMVIGGGDPARTYQKAYKEIMSQANAGVCSNEADWIGIAATRLNAQLVKAVFSDICNEDVIYDPTAAASFSGKILVAAGWKPGFSTDNDAVLLAQKFSSKLIINLSNIAQVYTDDPKTNPNAKPIEKISWDEFIKIVGTEWIPGKNAPFDPIASAGAKKDGIKVICAAGSNLENLKNILDGKNFHGTTIG